uniref:Putative anticomplement protein 2 n=1 Tax=Ixodes ricinus TaxID=34613 RepID=A0A6B0UUE3_IXORI
MEAALIRMLLGTAFVGMQFSPYALIVAYDESLYKRVLGRDPGICGAWYRNRSKTEEIMKCVLGNVSTVVKKQWEDYMDDNCLTVTELVSEMCNLTTIMPSSFVWYGDEDLTRTYNNQAEKAGIECTANITGWNTKPRIVTAPSQV